MKIIFNFADEITKYGLTIEQYEDCLKDCSDKINKTIDVDWSDIVDKYNLNIHFDTLRKAQQTIFGGAFVNAYYQEKYASISKEDTYFAELLMQKQEIRKEKQKLFDERIALNKILREQARKEEFIELIKRTITEHVPIQYNYSPAPIIESDNDLIVHLTDIHAGIKINSYFNNYNIEILKTRLEKYLVSIYEIRNTHNSKNCYLILGGDLISGLIHVNQRIENNENVVEQIMIVSELISNFTNALSKLFQSVEVYTTSGNHSRAVANKEEALKGENFDLLVPHYMKASLKYVTNVKINDNTIDEGICTFEVRGHQVVGVHGDKDTVSNIVYHMTALTRYIPDIIYLGHRHTNGLTTIDNVKVIESGCVDGMDSYALDKRLVGRPEQTVTVVTQEKCVKCLYDIQLD